MPHIPFLFGYGNTQIGSFYEKAEYTETYIVAMSRKPQSEKERTVYYLPAEIYRAEDFLGATTSHGGEQEYDINELNYHILHLYFPNGGYLYFDEDYPEDCILKVNQETKVTDYKDGDYYITLTKDKATKSKSTK